MLCAADCVLEPDVVFSHVYLSRVCACLSVGRCWWLEGVMEES